MYSSHTTVCRSYFTSTCPAARYPSFGTRLSPSLCASHPGLSSCASLVTPCRRRKSRWLALSVIKIQCNSQEPRFRTDGLDVSSGKLIFLHGTQKCHVTRLEKYLTDNEVLESYLRTAIMNSSRSTSGASDIRAVWILKIMRLVLTSGNGNSIFLSMRPGRIRAGSSDSMRFVAMIT